MRERHHMAWPHAPEIIAKQMCMYNVLYMYIVQCTLYVVAIHFNKVPCTCTCTIVHCTWWRGYSTLSTLYIARNVHCTES